MIAERHLLVRSLVLLSFWLAVAGWSVGAELSIHPSAIQLRGQGSRQQLLVTVETSGRQHDRTREASFVSSSPSVARISPDGVVTAVGTGQAIITARVNGFSASVHVGVVQGEKPLPVTFERDVIPILSRYGCNQGACHGKARGQNGFALSLLGFDRAFDYQAITAEARGRRIFPASPENSLLLMKASGRLPHGGGKALPATDPCFERLSRWIASGCPRDPQGTPSLTKVTVFPSEQLLSFGQTQQLVVTAHYSDGHVEDVTHLASFSSSESVFASVDAEGKVKAGPIPGEAAIMARFQEQFAIANILIPNPQPAAIDYAKLPRNNFIDELVWSKLQRLGLEPSDLAPDATFHRRAYLDIIGRLPTPAETRSFLAEKSPDKRSRLIDRLLDRPEYADFWANKWADLLRPNPYRAGIKATYNIDSWLREQFRRNIPYDQFVRQLLTASGSSFRNGAAVMYRDRREPEEIATSVSQLFLGVRLECAKCHHHPFEIWGQDDFYAFAAFFNRIGRKGQGISAPISGGEEIIFPTDKGKPVLHPVTGQALSPTPLLGQPLTIPPETDPRAVLADWMVSAENPYFAKVIVNRVWADLMGRGLVEPVDDLRATNPPTNPELLDGLATQFRENGFDLKKLIRTIATSYVYGLSTASKGNNAGDLRNYSRHYRRRLRAEVLLDAVTDVSGVEEKFAAMPPGTRAMQMWTVRSSSEFLDSFGRPDPNQDPPCERTTETTVVQALHLMNSAGVNRKVSDETGRAAKLAMSRLSNDEIIEELYLLTYCRLPTDSEKAAARLRFEQSGSNRRAIIEDLMWALINTPEFVFND